MFVLALSSSSSCSWCSAVRAGRIVYAIGSIPEPPQSGLPVGGPGRRVHRCGALRGLGGLPVLGRFGTINVTAGSGLELAAIAAAVVGGVSTLGGSGRSSVLPRGGADRLLDQSLVRVPQISEFWRDAVLGR